MISRNAEVLKDLEALQNYIKAELNVVKVIIKNKKIKKRKKKER